MGQIFDRISRLTRAYLNDARTPSQAWAEDMINSDDEELRRIIDELHAAPQEHHLPADVRRAFTILGIAPTSDQLKIKTAYRTAIATWHPDKFANADPSDQLRAQEHAREINAAYVLLKAYYEQR